MKRKTEEICDTDRKQEAVTLLKHETFVSSLKELPDKSKDELKNSPKEDQKKQIKEEISTARGKEVKSLLEQNSQVSSIHKEQQNEPSIP